MSLVCCGAATEGEALVDYLKTWSLAQPPSEAVAKKLLELVRRHFFVGAMPEAVGAYAERKDLLEMQRIQPAQVETMQLGARGARRERRSGFCHQPEPGDSAGGSKGGKMCLFGRVFVRERRGDDYDHGRIYR
jgi:hypothetical protein